MQRALGWLVTGDLAPGSGDRRVVAQTRDNGYRPQAAQHGHIARAVPQNRDHTPPIAVQGETGRAVRHSTHGLTLLQEARLRAV